MKLTSIEPPREFSVGIDRDVKIRDCAHITLEADEMVTFLTEHGNEYDVVRKDWGFYATPSMNSRLPSKGLRAALVSNTSGHLFVMLVAEGRETAFAAYLEKEKQQVLVWLDHPEAAEAFTEDAR